MGGASRQSWSIVAVVVAAGAIATGLVSGIAESPIVPAGAVPDRPAPIAASPVAGSIESWEADGDHVTISGWGLDTTGPTDLRLTIDGEPAGTLRPDQHRSDLAAVYGTDGTHGFTTRVRVGSSPVRLCVETVSGGHLVDCERVVGESHRGVLISPTGVMGPILATTPNGHRIGTPCGNEAEVRGGTVLPTVQVLLDPGHGGSEVAAVGPNGLSEKDLNLDVALITAELLRERGYSVALTRTADIRLPIASRAAQANALEPDLFISIHHNGGFPGRSSVPGTQTYYQHDDPEARRAAGLLHEELFAAAQRFPTAWVGNSRDGVSTRLNSSGTDFYGIHRRTPDVTSVITEFLWLSNGPEARLLARSDVQFAEAEAIARGVERWYQTSYSGSGFLGSYVDNAGGFGGGFAGCVDPRLS